MDSRKPDKNLDELDLLGKELEGIRAQSDSFKARQIELTNILQTLNKKIESNTLTANDIADLHHQFNTIIENAHPNFLSQANVTNDALEICDKLLAKPSISSNPYGS